MDLKKLTEVHDFKPGSGEKEMIAELLKIAQQWKENTCLTDWPLARLLESVEIRCLEILMRGKITTVD